MTRIFAVVAALLVVTTTQAADLDVQDFVDFQVAKLTTYPEAYDQYTKDKKPVVVWVKATDDKAFEAWRATRSAATHVFVNEFVHVKEGFVVGGERNGKFVVLTTGGFTPDVTDKINAALAPPKTRSYTLPVQNCPNGQCPRR